MASRATKKKKRLRPLALTAAYLPASEGGYVAEVLEATGVHTQGETFEETRQNLFQVIELMLDEAPHQFGGRRAELPPGAITERIYILRPE
jgi:predicted RNase H-like HicB family nuclease